MATSKVALGLDRLSIDEKAGQFATIEQLMTGNAKFPTPAPALAAVRTACDAMTTQQVLRDKLRQQAKQATLDLRTAEDAYDTAVTALGAYVDNVAQGDAAVIESAGMPATNPQDARPLGKLPAPEAVAATMGDEPGEVDVHWHAVKGARAYTIRYGQNGPASFPLQTVVTRSRGELTGLTSGQEVWLQVLAVGPEGGAPSQPVRCMVP